MKRLQPLRIHLSFASFAVDTVLRSPSLQIRHAPSIRSSHPIRSLQDRRRYSYSVQPNCHWSSTKTHSKERSDSPQQQTTVTMNGTGPTTRSKRKHAPSPAAERPNKQFRQSNGKVSPSENTPDEEMGDYVDTPGVDDDDDVVAFYQAQPGDSAEWQAMVQRVVRNVVSIRFCQTCSFDTDAACASEATGFVVDAEKGSVNTGKEREEKNRNEKRKGKGKRKRKKKRDIGADCLILCLQIYPYKPPCRWCWPLLGLCCF